MQTKKQNNESSNREVKSSAFTAYFSYPENAAALYNALEGSDVQPEDIIYETLSGVLFMARKNDMAFSVKRRVLVISEHQSTLCLNMPLRNAIYYGRTMEKLIEPKALYKNNLIQIPTPEFYVFYNGTDTYPTEGYLKLSDAYLENEAEPMLELKTKIININLESAHPLLEKCRPVYEYSYFIQQIRNYQALGSTRDTAITQAIDDCISKKIMTDFLLEHGSEVVNMLFTEFNMEDALEVRGAEKFAEGKGVGHKEGKEEGLRILIESYLEDSVSSDIIVAKLVKKYNLSEAQALQYVKKYSL